FRNAKFSGDDQFNLPEGPRALFAGDALTRALAADLLAGNGPFQADALWTSPFLVEALNDNYPIVRFFAANGLASQPRWPLQKFDYLAPASTRELLLKEWRAFIFSKSSEQSLRAQQMAAMLRTRRRDVDLEVGE